MKLLSRYHHLVKHFSTHLTLTLQVCWLDGNYRKVIFQSTTHNPREIAVNPSKRYIYWLDYGQFPMIARANLDGSDRKELVTTLISDPRDLVIDMLTNDVFWVDSKMDAIFKIDYQGGNRQMILKKPAQSQGPVPPERRPLLGGPQPEEHLQGKQGAGTDCSARDHQEWFERTERHCHSGPTEPAQDRHPLLNQRQRWLPTALLLASLQRHQGLRSPVLLRHRGALNRFEIMCCFK